MTGTGARASPLTIGIDFRPALSRATGVGRYFQGLVGGLEEIDAENRYLLFSSSLRERPDRAERPANFRLVDRRVPVRVLNALWHRLGVPPVDLLLGEEIDIAHSPTPLLLPSRRARSVVTICDLFFLERPEATAREIRRDYARLVRDHVRRADSVLAISETTANDAADKLGVPRERITVARPGVDARFLDRARNAPASPSASGGRPYLLTVATLEPRKNVPVLLEAVARLRDRGWDGRLLVAGGPGLDSRRVRETLARRALDGDVELLGYVGADALPSLYRSARALVMPSLWEGFGLPLLEAMAAAVPIVASDIAVHREVAATAAVYADPAEPESFARAIESIWDDEDRRAALVSRGAARASAFSWKEAAANVLAMYRALGESSRER